MKDFKYKKQVVFGLSLTLFICALASLIAFFILNVKTTLISSNTLETNTMDITSEDITDTTDIPEEEIPEIITEEKVSEEELKKEKVDKKEEVKKATSPYYIKVNYGANTVTIYKKDKNGKYTVPVKAMVCSCGTYTPTSGTYKISSKYRWGKLIHDVYGQYATRIVGSILFHSVPYSSNKNNTLLYKQYDRLGTTASAGCVRLTVQDAKWIYSNCPSGTMVEFYSSSNPGPLGKPSAQKISSVEECRNWDPTDPASGNPWHTYNPNKENNSTSNNTSTTIPESTNTITNSNNNINNNTLNNTVTNNNNIINNTINNNVSNNTTNNTTNDNLNNTVNNIIENNTTTNSTSENNTQTNTNTNPQTNITYNNVQIDNTIAN